MADVAPRINRVVVVCNDTDHTLATAAALIQRGVHVVGIVCARPEAGRARLARLKARNGWARLTSKIAGGVLIKAMNGRRDQQIYRRLYHRQSIDAAIVGAGVPTITCDRYDEPQVRGWIDRLEPDILVVHSASWVGRRVRALARTGWVIGGHPGITQHFRGGYSSFHALLQRRPDLVGWTVFLVDHTVDGGAVLAQGRTVATLGDSFLSLDWRGMIAIAEAQADLVLALDQGETPEPKPLGPLSEATLFGFPTITELLLYKFRTRDVR